MAQEPRPPRDEIGALVAAARAGDHHAWQELYDLYRPHLLLFCARVPEEMRSRFDGEDVVQSAFLCAFQQLPGLKYKDEASFRGWLKEIAANQLLDRIRSNDRRRRAVDRELPLEAPDEVINESSESETPSRILSLAESQSKVLAALDKLPPDQQELLWMREFEHKTFPDIARALGCTETTIRRRYKDCIEALLRLMG